MEEPWDFLIDKCKKLNDLHHQLDDLQKALLSVVADIQSYAFEITGEEELKRKGIIKKL